MNIEKRQDLNEVRMRHSFMIILNYAIILSLFVRGIYRVNLRAVELIDGVNFLGTLILITLLLHTLFRPYLIISEDKLTIFKSPFRKKIIDITRIENINASTSPFGRSYFILNDGTKIGFNRFALRHKDLAFLEKEFTAALSN